MARDIKPSKRPSKFPSLSKKNADRTRGKLRPRDKGKARAIDDVYEYAPSKTRRSKISLSLDRHEIVGRRHGSEDDDEIDGDLNGLSHEAMQKLRARLMRNDEGEDGGGQVDSEDDEDIESEDAFEESDREGFAGSAFVRKGANTRSTRRNKASSSKRHVEKEVDLNEDTGNKSGDSRSVSENGDSGEVGDEDEEMDDGSAGEFYDALDVFDGRPNVEGDDLPSKVDRKGQGVTTKPTRGEQEMGWERAEDSDVGMSGDEARDGEHGDEDTEGDDDEEEEDEDEDDEERLSASDSEDPSPEALADLESFLSKLDPAATHKRKPEEVEPGPKKRQRVSDRTEAGEESEFGVRGSSTLKLDDLLAPLASSSSSLVALKKSTKPLTSSSLKTKTLSAPLPQRAQERLDREAAYEKTKEEVDKWTATMKRIKEAEHLSFPLQAEKPSRVSNLELAARFTPSNELESAVDKLLKSAQLRDEDIEHTEALKTAHLSVEEVAARRAELRMMRELAFRADKKAKRVAKIKSKTYRRIRKKQRERLDGTAGDEDADAEDEEARLKAEVERARERATLRHKNTGKWAKGMKGREGLDQDQRQAISDMLERGEKLRRRIRGDDSGDEGSDDSESDGEERDEEQIKRGAFEELAALRAEDDSSLPDLKDKSVFNMKFMRDAATRQAREADAHAEQFQKEMGFGLDEEGEGEEGDDGTATAPPNDTTMVQRTGARISFRPGAIPGLLRPLGSLASDTSSVTLQSTDLLQDIPAPEQTPTPSLSTPTPTLPFIPNPWLVATASSSGPSRKRNEVRVHEGADALTKSSNKLKKQAEKHEDERERAKDDAVLEIDANNVLTIPEPPAPEPAPVMSGKKKGKAKQRQGSAKVSAGPTSAAHDDGNEVRVHEGADALTKSSNKLKKKAEKHEDGGERAKVDAVLEVDANNVLTIPEPPTPEPAPAMSGKKSKRKDKQRQGSAKASVGPTSDDDSDVPSEVEEQERTAESKNAAGKGKGVQAFQQRELVALAFAGDNVVQAFEEAKRQETEADAPREVDTTLPGWGAWGGTGTKKLPPKPHLVKSVPGIVPTARTDHAKPHLIVSEKRDKKAAKYLVRELPHPYTSHAQFERRMDAPLGSEWNTRVGFQRGTLPRVVKKMGTVIDPLERLF